MGITESHSLEDTNLNKISELLDEFNIEQTGISDNQPLDFYIRDEFGEVNGGLVGRVLVINLFFYRQMGLGSELLKSAEEEARR